MLIGGCSLLHTLQLRPLVSDTEAIKCARNWLPFLAGRAGGAVRILWTEGRESLVESTTCTVNLTIIRTALPASNSLSNQDYAAPIMHQRRNTQPHLPCFISSPNFPTLGLLVQAGGHRISIARLSPCLSNNYCLVSIAAENIRTISRSRSLHGLC